MSINTASEAYVKYWQRRREQVIGQVVAYVNQPSKRSLCQVLATKTGTSYTISRGLCQSTQQAKPMSGTGNEDENKLQFQGTCSGRAHARISSIFNQNVIGIWRKIIRESPSQNLINFQLECNRNFKENAQGEHKPNSHKFSIRL